MPNTILVSLDGSLAAEAALWEVEKLVCSQLSKVILLSVEPTVDLERAANEMRRSAAGQMELQSDDIALLTYRSDADIRRYLEPITQRLEAAGAQLVVEVSFHNPASEILFYARHYKANMIVMATHGRVGLDRILHGSVTEAVMHSAHCPMLVVHMPKMPLPRFVMDTKADVLMHRL